MIKKIYNRNTRLIGLMLLDVFIIVFAYFYGAKVIEEVDLFSFKYFFIIIGLVVALKVSILGLLGLYNLIMDFVGFSEVFRISVATVSSNLLLYIFFSITGFLNFEFSMHFYLYATLLEGFLIVLTRFSKRLMIRLGLLDKADKKTRKTLVNTLVIGAGSGGKLVLDEINKNKQLKNRVVAFVDDDPNKIKKRLNTIPILGPIANSLEYANKYHIEEIIIAIAAITSERLKEIIKIFENTSIKIKRLPLMTEIAKDSDRRIVDVNIEDLLGRGAIVLSNGGLKDFIKDRVVLVTGGGGSIGSELCNQILSYCPKTLIIFDIYENTTYDVQLALMKRIEAEQRSTKLVVLIGSVYNDLRIESVFKTYRPDLVFHAAAYKHVPLMEDSAVEAVRTNVLGTYNVARLSDKYEVKKMVLVSTDKAVRPTNVMGATKNICERIIQYFASISKTNYSAVRFGNVLGSNGSVVPLFKRQIAAGGPLTVTDIEITRYFMTIPEAVSLILQSGVYAKGGEIFILDMGEPVKIYDLAEKMIRLSGLVPNVDIMIVETGLRPGEKLYEELLVDKDLHIKTANEKIFIERQEEILDVQSFIAMIKEQFEIISNQEVKEMVQKLVVEYVIDDHTSN